jgi:hypothetical protein
MESETTLDANTIPQLIGPVRQLLEGSQVRDEFHQKLERERLAEQGFRQQGYLTPTWPTRHPLLSGLLAYERWLAGGPLEAAVTALASAAYRILAFNHDWIGHERWLAPRLLGDAFQGATFEFVVAQHFASRGYQVEYLAAKTAVGPTQAKGPDIVVHADQDIFVECVVGSDVAGRQIPAADALELARLIFRHMLRQRVYRVVSIEVDGAFSRSDTQQIAADVRAHLQDTAPATFDLLSGKYRIVLENGGTTNAPLTRPELAAFEAQLQQNAVRWGDIESSALAPGRGMIRGVTIGSKNQDSALSRLARAVAGKVPQLSPGEINVVAAGFGSPILAEQVEMPNFQLALNGLTEPIFRNSTRLSGVVYMFRTAGQDDASGQLIGELPWDVATTYALRNSMHAAKAIPATFRIA